jgi:hypothetical protein
MYYFNGHVHKKLYNWLEILKCIRENNPIIVLHKNVGSSPDGNAIHVNMDFVINPSSIAMVFPMKEKEKSVPSETVAVDQYLNAFTEYRDHVCVPEDPFEFPGKCKICGAVKEREAKKDFWLCGDCGAQLPDCICYKQ